MNHVELQTLIASSIPQGAAIKSVSVVFEADPTQAAASLAEAGRLCDLAENSKVVAEYKDGQLTLGAVSPDLSESPQN